MVAGRVSSSAPPFTPTPKYSSNNPARARIRLIRDPIRDVYVPVYAGDYAPAECAGRDKYTIDGKEYDECAFCRASCPSREEFKEPDSGLPLKCDMCEGEEEPLCVKWCLTDALVLEEREEEVDDEVEKRKSRRSWRLDWNRWQTNMDYRRYWIPLPGCQRRTE